MKISKLRFSKAPVLTNLFCLILLFKVTGKIQFSDVLDEETGRGYQRPINTKHSTDFRKYAQGQKAQQSRSLLISAQNIRDPGKFLEEGEHTKLVISRDTKVPSQIDCQHRLGYIGDLDLNLPFMTFVGLDKQEEMAIFNVINSKAKGLSSSLTDFHDSKLLADLEIAKPELYLAIKLNDDVKSPWYKQLDLGGTNTSGMQRRASFEHSRKQSESSSNKLTF